MCVVIPYPSWALIAPSFRFSFNVFRCTSTQNLVKGGSNVFHENSITGLEEILTPHVFCNGTLPTMYLNWPGELVLHLGFKENGRT